METILQNISADGWASIASAVIGGLIGALGGAYGALLGVRATFAGEAKARQAQDHAELAAIRQALSSEVGMVGLQCLREYQSWSHAAKQVVFKNPRTAFLPKQAIYDAMTPQIGRLSREEIVALVGFAGTLADIEIVANDRTESEVPARPELLVMFSNACGAAADCLAAIPVPDASKDKTFIDALRRAYDAHEDERKAAAREYRESYSG